MPETATFRPCPACGGNDIALFMTGIFDSDTTSVLECAGCGLHYLDVIMSEQEEADYYDGYYQKQQSRGFSVLDLNEQQERSRLHYEQYRDLYFAALGNSRTMLEIGCGTGGFLRFALDNIPGVRLTAIERDPVSVDFVRKQVKAVTVPDTLQQVNGQTFDAVLALGVFEHLRDGDGFLRDMRRYLTPDGRLLLKVPNRDNPLVCTYHLDEFKKFMYMKQHYWTLTEGAFEIVAARNGYRVDGFHYMLIWGLDNHLSWLRYRRPRYFSDITLTLSPAALDAYNRDLIRRKTTDTFMAVLRPEAAS